MNRTADDAKHAVKRNWTIAGSLCTMNDILVRNLELEEPRGDYLMFENAGAYSVTEGMAVFLSHELPTVYCCQRKQASS